MRRYTSHDQRPEQREIAREMGRVPTSTEALLWERPRDRRLKGFKFRRQHPAGRFIADFYCVEAGLVVELDGSEHDDPEERQADEARQQFLERQRLKVVRFRNSEVHTNVERVLATIADLCDGSSIQAGGRGT